MKPSDPISFLVNQGISEGVFPGAVLLVLGKKEVIYQGTWGKTSIQPDSPSMVFDTLFDVASLTKVMATATGFLLLIGNEKFQKHPPVPLNGHPLTLDVRVEEIIPELKGLKTGSLTIGLLLSHSAGFPDTRPYYRIIQEEEKRNPGFLGSIAARKRVYEWVHRELPIYTPGSRQVYSDLGFILLGELLECLSGVSLDVFCHKEIFDFLDMQNTGYRPGKCPPGREENIAATEDCSWRGKVLAGEVHDDNAYAMGGVAGHAGVFSNAGDIGKFASHVLSAWHGESSRMNPVQVHAFTRSHGPEWGLGWMLRTEPSSSGKFFSPASFGHLGFTGTSLWIDPEQELIVVFLTNRVHPSRNNEAIRLFRPRLHDLIVQEICHD